MQPCGAATELVGCPVIDANGVLRMISRRRQRPAIAVSVGSGAGRVRLPGGNVFVVDDRGTLQVSRDIGRHWQAGGTRSAGAVTSLAPIGRWRRLRRVRRGARRRCGGYRPTTLHFTRVPLPGWVARLGGQGGGS